MLARSDCNTFGAILCASFRCSSSVGNVRAAKSFTSASLPPEPLSCLKAATSVSVVMHHIFHVDLVELIA